jgi:hypothetical protein
MMTEKDVSRVVEHPLATHGDVPRRMTGPSEPCFTKGPWRTRVPSIPITRLAADDRMVLGRAYDGSERAIVDRVRGGTPEEANGNALLIAAAPAMYAELELAADTFRDFSNVLRAIGKDTMSAAANIAERHIREQPGGDLDTPRHERRDAGRR